MSASPEGRPDYLVATRVFDAGSPVGEYELRAAKRISDSVQKCLDELTGKAASFTLTEVEISSITMGDQNLVQVTVIGSP